MEELLKLLRGFRYAMRGIVYGVRTQRNIRIHLAALATVCIAGHIARLTVTHWCLVLLCCMAVLSLELVNTALEAACDAVSRQRHPLLGHAKDAAAGAVLVSAVGSVVIAAVLLRYGYGESGEYYMQLARLWRCHPWTRLALVLWGLAVAVFVFLPSYLQKRKKK